MRSLDNLCSSYYKHMATTVRTSAARRELRFDAGSIALNLMATLGRRGSEPGRQVERLADIAALDRWCDGVGIELAEDVDKACLLRELRSLRATLSEVAGAALTGSPVSNASLEILNAAAILPVPVPRLVSGQAGPGVTRPVLAAGAVRAVIVRDLMELLGNEATRARLRECDAADCRMLYLLAPGARERRWCSMSRCGNRAKAAAHRARHEAAAPSAR